LLQDQQSGHQLGETGWRQGLVDLLAKQDLLGGEIIDQIARRADRWRLVGTVELAKHADGGPFRGSHWPINEARGGKARQTEEGHELER
jgi:hypothetical protein